MRPRRRRRRGTARGSGRPAPARCRQTRTGRQRPPGFQFAVDAVPVLEHAGDVALAAVTALRRAGHLDREHVLVAEPRQRRDVERVGEEVALGVAEVGAVEPDVGLVEDAVERHPAARRQSGSGAVEAMAMEQRTVAVGELGMVPPVPGDRRSAPTSCRRRRGRSPPAAGRRRPRSRATIPESSTAGAYRLRRWSTVTETRRSGSTPRVSAVVLG